VEQLGSLGEAEVIGSAQEGGYLFGVHS
jgi:hypothetical protein